MKKQNEEMTVGALFPIILEKILNKLVENEGMRAELGNITIKYIDSSKNIQAFEITREIKEERS